MVKALKKEIDNFLTNERKLTIKNIELLNESVQEFHNVCKRGIYKELNRKKIITDMQLNQLLGQLEKNYNLCNYEDMK